MTLYVYVPHRPNRRPVFSLRHVCYLRSDNLFMYLLITSFFYLFNCSLVKYNNVFVSLETVFF